MTEEKYNAKDIRYIDEKNQEYIAEGNRMTKEMKVIPTNGTSADDVKYAKRVEEIYINGINVTGCRHCMHRGFKAFPQCRLELDSFATACTQHKECEYKQLIRLKQQHNDDTEEIAKLGLDVAILEQEKKSNKELLIIAQNEAMEAQFDREKYKNALEEIRGLASPHCTQCSQIINIINEVLQ